MGMRTFWLIPLIAGLAAWPGCDRAPTEASPKAKAATGPARTLAPADWPTFRADVAMTGAVTGELGDALSLAWRVMTDGPIKSSPVVAGGVAYVGSADGRCYAVNVADGSVKWKRLLGPADDMPEIQAPPLVHDGTVYVGNNIGTFFALDAGTGAVRWTFEANDKITGGAVHATLADGRPGVFFGSYDGTLYCLEAGSGEQVWSQTTENYLNGTPAIDTARRQVVFGGCDGIIYAIDIDTRQVVSRVHIEHPNAGTAALHAGRAYLGHYGNVFVAADLETGQIAWRYEHKRFAFFSAAAVDGEHVVFGGRDRAVHCAGAADGTPRWRFETRGKVDSSPIIVGDRVFAGSDDGHVYLLDLATGEELWSYEIGRAVASSPAVSGDLVLIGSDDGGLYAFRAGQESTESNGDAPGANRD